MKRDTPIFALLREQAAPHLASLTRALGSFERGGGAEDARTAAKSLAAVVRVVDVAWMSTLADALARALADVPSRGAAPKIAPLLHEALHTLTDAIESPDAMGAEARATDAVKALRPAGAERLAPASARPPTRPSIVSAGAASKKKRPPLVAVVEPSLIAHFVRDLEGAVEEMNRQIIELETGDRDAALERLMRAAHSIKGAARVVGLDAAAVLSHAMEDCFVGAQKRTLELRPEQVDELLAGVDLLARLRSATADDANDVARGLDEPMREAAARLRGAASGRASAAPSAPGASTRPAEAAPRQDDDRIVRVSARHIERLTALAGESLVEARRAGDFVAALGRLRQRQGHAVDLLRGRSDTPTTETLAEASEELVACQQAAAALWDELERYGRRLEDLESRMYDEALKSRMRPFSDAIQGLHRLVRDTARQVGKQVSLEIVGERTEVDRDVLEALQHPLQHLVRNAIDHGVESPDTRVRLGKTPVARLRIEARHHAGMVALVVSDDGRGIDRSRLKDKIAERGLSDRVSIDRMNDAELLEFLFLPGVSTAREVTDLSGRGVGLDVVRSAVEASGGNVRVSTTDGRGTSFHLQLPVTRSVMRAIIVEVGGEPYAFPLLRVERIVKVARSQLRNLGGRPFVDLDGTGIGIVRAHAIFDTRAPSAGDELLVVVLGDRAHSYGLVVDRFVGEHDLVIHPLDRRLGKVPNVSSAALLADGRPVLILDVDDLLRSIERNAESPALAVEDAPAPDAPTKKRILVVDDSLTVREMERQMLIGCGYEVDVAVDGMDGWLALSRTRYDLVVSDVDMPRLNGFDLVRRIKQDEQLRAIPVVIVSYKDREEDRMKGLEAGANYYLTKSSFHDRTFLDAVSELIGEAA